MNRLTTANMSRKSFKRFLLFLLPDPGEGRAHGRMEIDHASFFVPYFTTQNIKEVILWICPALPLILRNGRKIFKEVLD